MSGKIQCTSMRNLLLGCASANLELPISPIYVSDLKRNSKMIRIFIASLVLSTAAVTATHAQDISAGEKVFKKCSACHVANEEKNKIGPHLFGIVDRPAGSIEGFKYSKGLVAAAEQGLVWTEADIAEYLVKPRSKVKGTKMSFAGLKNEEDIANVIAYMASQSTQ